MSATPRPHMPSHTSWVEYPGHIITVLPVLSVSGVSGHWGQVSVVRACSRVLPCVISAFGLSLVVERVRKCFDFSFTVYFNHLVLSWVMQASGHMSVPASVPVPVYTSGHLCTLPVPTPMHVAAVVRGPQSFPTSAEWWIVTVITCAGTTIMGESSHLAPVPVLGARH
jgi:hypothetical protein